MKGHKISIITPSYNSALFIEQTIDSVLSQQYPNLEYIIIDGGSKDGTAEIIKKYSKHLTYWVSEPDNGQSDAINKGFSIATGEIINWLNADDFYENKALQIVSDEFKDNKITAVSGRCRVVDVSGKKEKFITKGTDVYHESLPKTIGWARIDQPSTFFRRSIRDRPVTVNNNLHYIMDKELWCRFLLASGLNGIRQINDVLVNFRHHDQSKTIGDAMAFDLERLHFFYSVAVRCNLLDEIEVFKQLYRPDQLVLVALDMRDYNSHSVIKTALHYFFLLLAEEYYVKSDRPKVLYLISKIDEKLLLSMDLKNMQKIKQRSTHLPLPLINLVRKIKSWM